MAEVAKRAKVNCVVGCNELSDRPGSLTIYNSLIVISRDGKILGRHRKLMPIHTERAYWDMGDANDIRVFRPGHRESGRKYLLRIPHDVSACRYGD